MSFASYLVIALGSALGGVSRFWVSVQSARWFGEDFPYGTLAVNILGSLLIGWLFAATGPEGRWLAPLTTRQFLITGFCGGFTTFSAFSLESFNLARDGHAARAAAYVALSLVLCLASVWIGYALASSQRTQ